MDKSAVYIPDPTVQPHRVCYMGFFSPNMVRPGTSSLVAETTVRPGSPTDQLSDDDFIDLVVGDLDRAGIIRKQDVIVTDTKRIEYAYPVYDRRLRQEHEGVARLVRVARRRATRALRGVRLHQLRRVHSPGDEDGRAVERGQLTPLFTTKAQRTQRKSEKRLPFVPRPSLLTVFLTNDFRSASSVFLCVLCAFVVNNPG